MPRSDFATYQSENGNGSNSTLGRLNFNQYAYSRLLLLLLVQFYTAQSEIENTSGGLSKITNLTSQKIDLCQNGPNYN